MIDWSRRRHPDDVPTPVAVAVSDFCRRARAPATAAQVRDALSLLSEADDFRVRALTDGEPEANPLGPFAVVDVISGAAQSLAAQRETTGYYELVQALADERAKKAPAPSAPARLPPAAEAAVWRETAGQPVETPRPVKTKAKSMAEKIAPKKRVPGDEPVTEVPEQTAPGTAFLSKRSLPAPRGRFTRVETARASYEDLLAPAMRAQLDALIDQTSTRIQMRQALELGYSGQRGVLSVKDVEEAVDHHKLRPRLEKKEKEVLISSLREARGSTGRASTTMGMTPQEFTHLTDTLSLRRDVDEVRSHFVREALSPKNLSVRFDMLGRSRYLQDLGIEAKFQTALTKDLEKLIKAHDGEGDFTAVLKAVALHNGLNLELLTKTADRLGLVPDERNEEPDDQDFVED